jgi:hypothetical protein
MRPTLRWAAMAPVDPMDPADHLGTAATGSPGQAADGEADSHWVRWHRFYQEPDSPLSRRLAIVQAMVRDVLDDAPHLGPIRIVSLCAGQGRDVIDVVASHPRAADIDAMLVELDPQLVRFARRRAAEAGIASQVEIVEGDAALASWYTGHIPADLVMLCGIFGNIGPNDIAHTIQALPGWCERGTEVIWTRHRRPPDATPSIRAHFESAGFEEVDFQAPDGYVLSVGRARFRGTPQPFDPTDRLFDFVGDGALPA